MKDMKLVTLMAINKPEKKKLNEIISIHSDSAGVRVAIDDYDDVLFRSKGWVVTLAQLDEIIHAFAETRWFIKLTVAAAKRKVEIVNMEFTNDGIKFR